MVFVVVVIQMTMYKGGDAELLDLYIKGNIVEYTDPEGLTTAINRWESVPLYTYEEYAMKKARVSNNRYLFRVNYSEGASVTKTDPFLERKTVKEEITFLSCNDNLQQLIDTVIREGHHPSKVIIDYNDYGEFALFIERPETDKEYEARIKPYTAKLKAKEERDRKEYERLKKKFENC